MKLKKLTLNKETISSLDSKEMASIRGGEYAAGDCKKTQTCDCNDGLTTNWTNGCTDGNLCNTWMNCTKSYCTNDCPGTSDLPYTSEAGGY